MDNVILLPFLQYFSNIRTMDDHERLRAMEPRLRLERFTLSAGLEQQPSVKLYLVQKISTLRGKKSIGKPHMNTHHFGLRSAVADIL